MQNLGNEEKVIQTAIRYTGSQNFYGEDYRSALHALMSALEEEAFLSKTGILTTFSSLLDILVKRSVIANCLASQPEIAEIPIERPVFIIGFPRTGTTLLHNLLAQDSVNRTLRLWEMRSVAISIKDQSQWEREQIAETERFLHHLDRTIPNLRAIHPMHATWPEDCNWLSRNSFACIINAITYYIPGYLHWLLQQDMISAYTFYQRQLQLLLWRSPGKRLVLKDPCHLWHLDALLSVFPDARIVHLHRNILESLPSLCSLSYTLQSICSERREPTLVGTYCKEMVTEGMKRALSVRERVQGDAFIDMQYNQLIRNPIAAVQLIYAQLGWEMSSKAETAIMTWLVQNKQHKNGRHHYTLEQFGLDCTQIQESFAAYNNCYLKNSL